MNSDSTTIWRGAPRSCIPGYNGASGLEEENLGLEIGSRGSISEIRYKIAYFRTKIKDRSLFLHLQVVWVIMPQILGRH